MDVGSPWAGITCGIISIWAAFRKYPKYLCHEKEGAMAKKRLDERKGPRNVPESFDIFWCLRTDSNRHGDMPQGILSPLCLPIPPLRQPAILPKSGDISITTLGGGFNF